MPVFAEIVVGSYFGKGIDTGKDYHVVLNDVYRVGSMTTFSDEIIDSVKQKLMSCNYEKWLADE
ncbi:MAG: hypothetical protein ACYT04_36740 [Nostoc sp.]